MIEVTPAQLGDLGGITAIYNHYIKTSVATFEENELSEEQVQSRIDKVRSASLPWLVARGAGGPVLGYCYARPWHERSAYRFSVETSLYVADGLSGKGIGSRLYEVLLQALRERGFHTAIGGISLPNAASVALHEKFGFEKVAHYRQVGRKFEAWIDVGYFQLML